MPILEPSVALDRLKSTPRELVALVGTAKADTMHRPAGDDEDDWSPATVLSHFADAELVYSVRLRMALTADRPYLAGYDEDAWVRRFAELDADPKETLVRWRALRDANLRLLDSLEPGEWKLTGLHAERGEVSIAHLADLMVTSDREHLRQIRVGLSEA